jgi:hypothetical protein
MVMGVSCCPDCRRLPPDGVQSRFAVQLANAMPEFFYLYFQHVSNFIHEFSA